MGSGRTVELLLEPRRETVRGGLVRARPAGRRHQAARSFRTTFSQLLGVATHTCHVERVERDRGRAGRLHPLVVAADAVLIEQRALRRSARRRSGQESRAAAAAARRPEWEPEPPQTARPPRRSDDCRLDARDSANPASLTFWISCSSRDVGRRHIFGFASVCTNDPRPERGAGQLLLSGTWRQAQTGNQLTSGVNAWFHALSDCTWRARAVSQPRAGVCAVALLRGA